MTQNQGTTIAEPLGSNTHPVMQECINGWAGLMARVRQINEAAERKTREDVARINAEAVLLLETKKTKPYDI